jgi:hypothetical protein
MIEAQKNVKEQLSNNETILADILLKFSSRDKSVPVADFIREQLVASGDFIESEARQTVAAINRTIDSNSRNMREIQEYKKKGLSSAMWLRDLIDKVTSNKETRKELIESLKNAFNKNNLEMASQMTGEKVEKIVRPLEATDFDDPVNKNAIANNLKDEIEINTHLRFMQYGSLVTSTANEKGGTNEY